MVQFPRVAVAWGVLLIVSFCAGTASAQLFDDVGPRPTPDPHPLPNWIEQILNPSLRVPGAVTFDFADDTLTDEQKARIVRAHILAWQQVRAALRYLESNARGILAGKDPFYNATFGQFYDRSQRNPLLGAYDIDVPAVKTLARPLGIADVSGTTVTFADDTPFLNNIQIGDRIVIGNQIHVVTDIQTDDSGVSSDDVVGGIKRLNTGDSSGGTSGDLPIVLLESIELEQDFDDRGGTVDTDEIAVRRVIGTTTVTNREHYERVVRTFAAIRDLLELDTQYSGDWDIMETDFNRIFQEVTQGQAQTPQGSFRFEGFDYDRGFRQFGYSNSNSQAHRDQLLLDPDNPLRWTNDNDRVLDGAGNPIPGEDLIFYHNQLTIFGEFDQGRTTTEPGTNTVYVGGGFLSESQRSVGGLFDGQPSDVERRTDLLQYQMIIAAFAEFSPYFRTNDVDASGNTVSSVGAGFGILDILSQFGNPNGTAELPFAQNMDAQVFAAFANIFSDPRLRTGIGDGTLLPPAGKNARARSDSSVLMFPFAPVVPTQ